MDAADLDPSAPICCCGDRGCAKPGHVPAFVEFEPAFRKSARASRKRQFRRKR